MDGGSGLQLLVVAAELVNYGTANIASRVTWTGRSPFLAFILTYTHDSYWLTNCAVQDQRHS